MKANKKLKKEIKDILNFYDCINVQLSKENFLKSLPARADEEKSVQLAEDIGYEFRKGKTRRIELLEEKWSKIADYRYLFGYVPFIDFVLVAGSVCLGNVSEDSDFDLLVGTEKGRIFTVRFALSGFLGILGLRKPKEHNKERKDKFCLNHFVTPPAYELDPPYNIYWTQLYRRLVPIYGKKKRIKEFFKTNNWAQPKEREFDKWKSKEPSLLLKALEFSWSGKLGNLLENILKKYQTKRIEKSKEEGFVGYKPHLKVSEKELRFHVDTKRIEEIISKLNK